MTDITTSHDPRDWREAFETTENGPELDRIRARVAAARQRGENDALVAVVLDEASKARDEVVTRITGATDDELTRRLEWATGRNGATLLAQIRAEGLDVIAVTPEQVAS